MQPILESFVVEAVATVMPRQKSLPTIQEEEEERQNLTGNVQIKSDHVSHGFKDRGSRESKRRRKIGEANKGKIPWNKGKKHSPETLALIRERTIIAMRNPEVRQKLSQCSRPHRVLPVAPSILWPSVQNSKLEEKRRCKRASKSDNQKLKISEAIKTKWADPVYRQRVQYGLRKFHGKAPALTLGRATEKWVSEVISGKEAQKTRNLYGSQTHVNKHKSLKLLPCARKKTLSSNLDPLTGSKLEMENKIRANQAAVDLKIRVATQRARTVEAEKAAKLLEPSAVKDAAVRASLYETRKLLAEATRAMGNAESCRNTDISILPRCSLTLTDAETFQSQHCMDASQLAASAVPAPGILNDSHCQPLSNNGKAYESDADKFRMDKSKCAYEKNMPFPSSEVGSGKFLQSVLSTFGAGEPEIETAGKLESMPGESLGKDSMLLAKLDSSGSSTIFNSYLISDEPTTKGTLGKLNAKSEQNINMDNVFCEETKSDGSSSGTNEARSVPIGNCFSTPKNMKKIFDTMLDKYEEGEDKIIHNV